MNRCELYPDDCDNEECRGIEDCPRCHASCHNDVTIADHGHCYDCHKQWQWGEWPEQQEEKEAGK